MTEQVFNSLTPTEDINKIKSNWEFEQTKKIIVENRKKIKKEDLEEKRIQNRYFDLLKNLTILSTTLFGSSIALVTGKSPGQTFIVGEFFLLLSTLTGILFLWSQLKSLEWSHFFDVTNRLKQDAVNDPVFIKEIVGDTRTDLINTYEKLMERKDLAYYILMIIKVDWLPGLFYLFLCLGLLLIWISLFL